MDQKENLYILEIILEVVGRNELLMWQLDKQETLKILYMHG